MKTEQRSGMLSWGLHLGASVLVALLVVSLVSGFIGSDGGGDPIPPVPTPDPAPGPAPGPVDEPFGADELAYNGAMKVKSKTRPAECQQLAQACRRIAIDIDKGRTKPVNPVLNALADEMGRLPKTWKPFFNDATTYVKKFYYDGDLKESHRWAVLLNETADGLDRAAKEKTGVGEEGVVTE